METLTANIAGKVRRETRNGREYVVAPMTLIVPGVLNGSQGPLFYPAEEIKKNASAWNGMPLVVDHPYDSQGNPISARSPAVLDAQGVGEVFNATVDGKLVAEGWFDVEKTQKVDARILNSLNSGHLLELSTGLFTDTKPAPKDSLHDGKAYSFIATNYRPDHLAILVDSKGACSIDDGCGVNVNANNELSHEDLQSALNSELKKRFAPLGGDDFPWVEDVFQNKVIYRYQERKYRLSFTRTRNKVSLSNSSPVEVQRVTQWTVITNKSQSKKKESTMDETKKKKIIDNLIANVCYWDEKERELLEGFSDAKLEGMYKIAEATKRHEVLANAMKKGVTDPSGNTHTWNEETDKWDMKEPKKKEEVTVNTEKPLTEEQWLKKAPTGVREQLSFAHNEMRKQKKALVERLTVNVKDEQRQAKLSEKFMEKSLEDLQDIAETLPEPVKPVANFSGAAAPGQVNTNAQKNFPAFGLPHEYIEDEKTE